MMGVVFVFAIIFAIGQAAMRHKNECDHCEGKLGLVRWRIGPLQFCTKQCKANYRRVRPPTLSARHLLMPAASLEMK
jgi:hypothetical protein